MAAMTYPASPKAVAYAKSLTEQTWAGTPDALTALLDTAV